MAIFDPRDRPSPSRRSTAGRAEVCRPATSRVRSSRTPARQCAGSTRSKLATIDVLGEEITNEEEAAAIVRAYQDAFADIERCGLDSNVSVKLTALGLKLDYVVCRDNL